MAASSDVVTAPGAYTEAVSCPSCSHRYQRLRVSDSKGHPRELWCEQCGTTFFVARCPVCRHRSTQIEDPQGGPRRYPRDGTSVTISQRVRCVDCSRLWYLSPARGVRDLTSLDYWRTWTWHRSSPDLLAQERDLSEGQHLGRSAGYALLLLPLAGYGIAAVLVAVLALVGPLIAASLYAAELWSRAPWAVLTIAAVVVGAVLASYLLARKGRVDSPLARAYVHVILGPVAYVMLLVSIFVYRVLTQSP